MENNVSGVLKKITKRYLATQTHLRESTHNVFVPVISDYEEGRRSEVCK
jgi:predicted transcriptional regulator